MIKRGADRHYPLMKTSDIGAFMDGKLRTTADQHRYGLGQYEVAADAHLYLWVTNNFLSDGLWVMKACGFRYVTNLVWVKPNIGIGQYFRGQHELCLFGVRGSGMAVRTEARNVPGVIAADYRRDDRGRIVHSGKPDAFYRLVERRTIGPRLELFGRRHREGWTVDGTEVPDGPR